MADLATKPALWTAAEAAAATGGRAIGRWNATGLSIDSRSLAPGDLFVALNAERDGHDFVDDAFARGASAALVARSVGERDSLIVKDTLAGLRGLAASARDRSSALRVAVTGSVGKTSLKEAIGRIFVAAGRAHWSTKSFNNHWGAPLSLARMPRETERAVFELGMNHADEIRPLSKLVTPHIAVVTKIAPAHVEALGSLEAIADAKAEIFEGLEAWGAAVIPGDDPYAARLAERAGSAGAGWLVRFGTDRQAEARILSYDWDQTGGRGEAEIFGRRIRYRLRPVGAHWGAMGAAALAAAYLADVPLKLAAEALAEFDAPEGRGRAIEVARPGGSIVVLDDAYNANPASMAAALQSLGARKLTPGGRRIAVLGEMFELGPEAGAMHAGLVAPIIEAGVDLVFLVGEGMKALQAALPRALVKAWAATSDALVEDVRATVRPGDCVLVKGSNAARMTRIVDSLTKTSS